MFYFKDKENQELCQWDYNIILHFNCGFPGQEVHFSNTRERALVKILNEDQEVMIPNILLQEAKEIVIYLYVKGENGYTWRRKFVQVLPRPKPDTYIYTEPEQLLWDDLDQRINHLDEVKIDKTEVEPLIKTEIKRLQTEGGLGGIPAGGKVGQIILKNGNDDYQVQWSNYEKDKNFVYEQKKPSSHWEIKHNLNKKPSVTVVDSADSTVVGEITYIDLNNLIIDFKGGFSGKAYLN